MTMCQCVLTLASSFCVCIFFFFCWWRQKPQLIIATAAAAFYFILFYFPLLAACLANVFIESVFKSLWDYLNYGIASSFFFVLTEIHSSQIRDASSTNGDDEGERYHMNRVRESETKQINLLKLIYASLLKWAWKRVEEPREKSCEIKSSVHIFQAIILMLDSPTPAKLHQHKI